MCDGIACLVSQGQRASRVIDCLLEPTLQLRERQVSASEPQCLLDARPRTVFEVLQAISQIRALRTESCKKAHDQSSLASRMCPGQRDCRLRVFFGNFPDVCQMG